MSNGELENLWVSEKHDTATGKKLFIDMITNVNELSNVLYLHFFLDLCERGILGLYFVGRNAGKFKL
jgi:hypothetical protein